MKASVNFRKAVNLTQDKLDDFMFKCAYKINSNNFLRKSKMGLRNSA